MDQPLASETVVLAQFDENWIRKINGMNMKKITVSLPAGIVEQAQRAVAERRARA